MSRNDNFRHADTLAELRQLAAPFLAAHGVAGEVEWLPLSAGPLTCVVRLRSAGADLVLKYYPHRPRDPRDRLAVERSFYEILWSRGVWQIPEPQGWDESRRLGLFQFIAGRPPNPDAAGLPMISAALGFLLHVNRARARFAGQGLKPAVEACICLEDHLATVTRRLERLGQLHPADAIERTALEFVRETLEPSWQILQNLALDQATKAGMKPSIRLKLAERMVSPGDFGLPNTLVREDGQLCFLDFTQGGWDDPARVINDFFCRSTPTVDLRHYAVFAANLTRALALPEETVTRANLLLPAYRLKACCEMLRSVFAKTRPAGTPPVLRTEKAKILRQTRAALRAIAETPAGG